MRITSPILSLFTTVLLAASLAACATGAEPARSTHEGAIANQEVLYIYYDCANPDVSVGWRLHACTATNAWSSDGQQSQCFEVSSEDCSNPVSSWEYCEYSLCESFEDGPDESFGDWARTN